MSRTTRAAPGRSSSQACSTVCPEMKKESRVMRKQLPLIYRRLMPVAVALVLTLMLAQPAFAWTHEWNTYDYTTNTGAACGTGYSTPCLYWPEPNHVSTTVYAYIDPSLDSLWKGYNMTTSLNNAFGYWNSVNGAFNPYVYDCQSGCSDAIQIQAASWLDPNIAGETTLDTDIGTWGELGRST